jgi:hypothetical protein
MLTQIARISVVLALCASATPLAAQAPSPAPATTSTQSLSPLGGTFALPAYGGFGGTLTYGNNDAQAGSVRLTLSTQHPPGSLPGTSSPLIGTSLAYLTASFSPTVVFSNGIGVTSLTLPPNVSAGGHSFVYHLYDLSNAQYLSTTTGTPSGDSSVTFGRPTGNMTVTGGHTFLVVFQML